MDKPIEMTLKHGFQIDGVAYVKFDMREATVDDMLEAEMEAGVHTPLNFNTQMLSRQITKITSASGKDVFEGPVTVGMIRKLKPADFRVLRAKQMEIDALGEAA